MKILAVGILVAFLGSSAGAEESALFSINEDPERITQIKNATELLRAPEALSSEAFEGILKDHDGQRFSGNIEKQGDLSKPVFEWINNNLFDKVEKPFVGFFPLIEEGATLGFVVVKKEMTELPVIYLLSPDGDLKHLTRRL